MKKQDKSEIFFLLLPWSVIFIQSYFFHKQLVTHFARIQSLENHLTALSVKTGETMEALQRSSHIETVLVASQNDAVPFNIKALGIAVAVVAMFVIVSNVYPAVFSAKTLLLGYPFFLTKKVFTVKDPACGVDWVVNIYNNKHLEVMVKPFTTQDLITVSDYLLRIQSDVSVKVVNGLIVYPADQTAQAMADFTARMLS